MQWSTDAGAQLSSQLAEQDASGWADQHDGEISTFVDASVNGSNSSNAAAEQRLHAVLGSFGTLLGGVLGGAAGAAIGGWLGSNAPAAKGSNQASTILDQVIIGAHEDMQTALRDYFARAGIANNMKARNVFAKAANRVAGLLGGHSAFHHDDANAGMLSGDWVEWQKRDIWRLTVDSWDPKQAAKRVRDTVKKWAVAAAAAQHALAVQGVGAKDFINPFANQQQQLQVTKSIFARHPIITTTGGLGIAGGVVWALVKYGILRV